MSRNSATRSGLLWEVERLLKECKNLPQILLMENVVQVHSYANRNDFSEWCSFLSNLGYTNYIADLSAENFDVPQSRIRCFMISILNDNFNYQFPNFITKTRNLYDFLQKRCSVDDFILNDFGKYIVSKFVNSDVFRYYTLNNSNKVEKLNIYISDTDSDVDIIHMCTCSGSIKKDINVNNDDTTKQRIFVRSSEYCGTLTTFSKDNIIIEVYELLSDIDDDFCFRDFVYSFENKKYVVLIRYLTPLECFRLMGFSDFDYEAVKNLGTSKDTMYFQTGNSIVVDVLYNIFKRML
jgi:DNA (cytosine-5)-methyltransferase 1